MLGKVDIVKVETAAPEVVEGETADAVVGIAVVAEEVPAVVVETVIFTVLGTVVESERQVPSILPLEGGEKAG